MFFPVLGTPLFLAVALLLAGASSIDVGGDLVVGISGRYGHQLHVCFLPRETLCIQWGSGANPR